MTDEKRLFKAIHSNRSDEPEATFNYIYTKYKALLLFIASKYIQNKFDVEDIVQETFIEFFNNAEKVHTSIKTYLTLSCKHNALDYLKKYKRMEYVDIDDLLNISIDEATYLNKEISNCKYIEMIESMNTILDKEDVTIILLHLVDDMKFDDIALKLNQNTKSIKSKYYRALKKYQKLKGVKQNEKN